MQNCIGSINVAAGSTGQALSTTAALLTCWNTAAGSNKNYNAGDLSVTPDKANNRVIVAGPGLGPVQSSGQAPVVKHRYKVSGRFSGTTDAAQDITFQLRRNGTVVADCISKQRWTDGVKSSQSFEFIVEVAATDVPGTIDPTPAAGGTFTGGTGAAKIGVALDLMVASGAGTPTITVENAELIVERVAD
jgi:hypothetical protein